MPHRGKSPAGQSGTVWRHYHYALPFQFYQVQRQQALPVRPGRGVLQGRLVGHAQPQDWLPAQPSDQRDRSERQRAPGIPGPWPRGEPFLVHKHRFNQLRKTERRLDQWQLRRPVRRRDSAGLLDDSDHAFFVQDSLNVGHGLTLNLGIRIEKEYLPAPAGYNIKSINFGWGDKIAPRLGAAWDPTGHGKMKLFGSYGVVNDVMKLLLAQTSWGAQAFEQCIYALGPDGTAAGFSVSDLNLTYVNGRACPNGPATTQANFATGSTPPPSLVDTKSGVLLIENINLRPWEPVAPGVKPYRQHEAVFGVDYQVSRDWAFEARYDRRRLDDVSEDASLSDPAWGETYTIVNPGEGVNKTIDGYAAYLTSLGEDFGVPGWALNGADDQAFGLSF